MLKCYGYQHNYTLIYAVWWLIIVRCTCDGLDPCAPMTRWINEVPPKTNLSKSTGCLKHIAWTQLAHTCMFKQALWFKANGVHYQQLVLLAVRLKITTVLVVYECQWDVRHYSDSWELNKQIAHIVKCHADIYGMY